MARRLLAVFLCVGILFSGPWPAAAQVFRPVPAASFPQVARFPAPETAGTALKAFGAWLGTPQGALALTLDPGLAGLKDLEPSSARGLLAIAPLIEKLPPGLLPKLRTMDRLAEAERATALTQLILARRAAADAVNAKAAGIVSGLGATAYSGRTTPGQLDELAQHLEIFRWYGGGIVEAAEFARSTASGLREALDHTRRVAEETAARLEALKPKVPILDAGPAPKDGARPAKKGPGLQLPVKTFKLDNGLTVVVAPDHASPTVAVSITYKVGSQHERPGRSGFAHLFEHLMAQGTKNLKPREISKLIEGNGGQRNAYTTRTNTTYHSVVPKSALETVLWAEADRMHTLDVNARALALEQQVVLEEMRRSYLNQPYRKAQDAGMAEAAFTRWENRHTTIGEAKDVREARLEDVKAFYESHYAPNNAVLTLAGDVSLEQAQELARRYFGGVPPREIAPAPDLSEPPLEGERLVTIPDGQAELPRLLIGWRAPERGTKEFWALSVLMRVLSGKDESPLYRAAVKEAGQAISLDADIPWWTNAATMHGPDLFGIDLLLKVGSTVEAAMAAVDRVLARLVEEGPAADELASAKAQAELAWHGRLAALASRAQTLGSYAAFVGDPAGMAGDLNAMLAVSAQDVVAAARRWIAGQGRRLVHVVPAAKEKPAPEPATPPIPAETPRNPAEAPPAPGPMTPAPLPEVSRFKLKNGLNVVFVKDDRLPLVEARLTIPSGKTYERPGEEGSSQALGGLLFSGTPSADGRKIAGELSKLGWAAAAKPDLRSTGVDAAGLARNAPAFFHLLGKVLAQASFPEGEVELWKRNTAQRLAKLRSDPEFMMDEKVAEEHYGADHPYGSQVMTDGALARIGSGGLAAFRERTVLPDGATLVLVGDLEASDVREMLEETLKGWKGRSARAEEPPVRPGGDARLVLVDRPGSTQANLTISQPVPLNRRHPDFLAFQVMSHILGGTSTSRLFVNLRVDKGYTYGSYSSLEEKGDGLLWVVNAETRSEVAAAALGEMRREADRMRDEPVPADVLEAAKRNLAGRFAIQLSAMSSAASRLSAIERSGLDSAEELRAFVKRLEALTPEDIQRAARRYLDPAKMLTVAVGDRATLAPILTAYRP